MDAQSFHDFAAVTFNGLDAEAELLGDVARSISFGNHLEHLYLAIGERVQPTPRGQGVGDRCLESAHVRLENHILGSGAYCSAGLGANEIPGNNDECRRWPHLSQYFQRGSRIELRERMVRQDDIRRKAFQRRSECFRRLT